MIKNLVCEYFTANIVHEIKKPFKQGAQKFCRPACKPKIKMKTGDWKKLDLFLQYTAFLGKHAVILSGCMR